jgi:hypothetical protein
MRRKVIAAGAKGADPELVGGEKVHLAIRIQHGMTRLRRASNRIVGQRRGRAALRRKLLQRTIKGAERSHTTVGFESIGRPAVEGEPRASELFGRGNVPYARHISFDLLL